MRISKSDVEKVVMTFFPDVNNVHVSVVLWGNHRINGYVLRSLYCDFSRPYDPDNTTLAGGIISFIIKKVKALDKQGAFDLKEKTVYEFSMA